MSARRVEGGGSSHRPALLALLAVVYPALAVASTWPLVTDLDGLLPLGTLDAATTSLLNVWTLWWNADRLAAGLSGYWDAPIFFPCRDTFALSEPLPLLGIVASPLFLFEASPVRNTNLVLLAMLALNGWMTFILLRRLGLHQVAAALAGACVVVLPYSHREIGVLHLVPLAGVLGTLWAGIGWIERPTTGRAIVLGVALAAAYLISSGHALFVALAGAPAFAWLLRRAHLRPRALLGLAVGALLCAGLVAPVVGAQLEAKRLYGMERPPGLAQAGAALPRDFWASPWPALLPVPGGQEPRRIDRLGLYPGSAKLALALMGLIVGLRQRPRRRATGFAVILLAGSVLLSMLPSLAGGAFFDPLRSLPGLGQIRSFYRAGVLAQLAVVILAALCLDALLVRARARPRLARATRVVAVLLGVLAVCDLWPRQQHYAEAPSLEAWAPWTSWVRANVGTREAMLHLPMPGPGRMRRFEADARWMVLQTAHGRPLVNGYSSFVPREIQKVARETTRFPQPQVHGTLASLGVRWIVAHPSWLQTREPGGLDPALWRPAYQNDALDVAVYEVVARSGEGRAPSVLPR
jgi:hypothetical protein